MRRIIASLAIILLLLAVRVPLVTPAQTLNVSVAATSSGVSAVDNFTIYVNSLGFNDTSGKLTLPVNQGDTVIINFIWNGTVGIDTPHQMEVQGYGVVSAVIQQGSPISVIKFTANQAGTFQINCIISCLGMENMQNAWLVVKPAPVTSTVTTSSTNGTTTSSTNGTTTTTSSTASSSTTVQVSTTLSSYQTLSLSLENGGLLASVQLMDSNGNPIAGASVTFSVMTDFGLMVLGSNSTDSNGIASFATATLPAGWTGVYTSYAGSGNLNSSSTSVVLNASALDPSQSNPSSPYISGQGSFLDLRLVGVPSISAEAVVYAFLLVLASVYVVLGIVLVRVLGIRRRA